MKNHICINCEKTFTRVDSLRRHQKHSCKKTGKVQRMNDKPITKYSTTLKQVNNNKNKFITEDILRSHRKYGCRKASSKQTLEEQFNLDYCDDGCCRGSEQKVVIYNDWCEVEEDIAGFRNC